MTEDVLKELNKKDQSEFHNSILDQAKTYVKRSRSEMSSHYKRWDLQDSVYRGERCYDSDDMEQERKGNPTKMVVPNTYAQVMTFVSFLFLMFNQNKTFFELTPIGTEDYGTKKVDSETLLEYNLRQNNWNTTLFQHLLDCARFGPAILDNMWTRDVTHAFVSRPEQTVNVQGVSATMRPGSQWEEFVRFEGNLIRPVSPYRFFPDTSVPLTEFQRGSFSAVEEDYTMEELYKLEAAGEVAGIEHIGSLPNDLTSQRGGQTRSALIAETGKPKNSAFDACNRSHSAIVTRVQMKLIPAKYKFGENKTLGPEEFPILYHVWYANDNRVIRCEPAMWWHGRFSQSISQFTPDMQQTVNYGLADLIYRLQDVINWYVNSHVSSVRRVMQNRLIVNPQLIDTNSLDGEGDIYMRKGIARNVSDGVFQLKVQDVTSGHMGDVEMMNKIMEVVTGVNGNAMGQYNSGRRSAQEARVVTAGAAGRMKMHGHLIFEGGLAPLAGMMLCNMKQSLSPEIFNRVIGKAAQEDPNRYVAFQGTPEEAICSCDYFTFDSTLASEKGFMAQSIQELLGIILSNPVAGQMLDLDARAMVEEMLNLRGGGDVGRFSLSKRVASGQASPLPPMALPNPGQAPAAA